MTSKYKPRSCYTSKGIRKRRYTKKLAKIVAKQQGRSAVAYDCPVCDSWHIGHPTDSAPRVAP